jgi:ATP-dependent Zn protease
MTRTTKAEREARRLTTTAYHEAGHAVACWVSGIGFRHVSIRPDDDEGSLGHVLHKRLPKAVADDVGTGYLSPRTSQYVESRAVVALAGQAAAERLHGRRGNFGSAAFAHHSKYGRVIVDGDQHQAVDLLSLLSGDAEEISLLWKLAAYRARRLVEHNWPMIEKLAAALIERRELTGSEVQELLYSALVSDNDDDVEGGDDQ